MSNAFVFGKKAFTWTVVVATILWAMSAAFIAIPLTASAATMAGDLIVGTALSTSGPGRPVYFVGSDMKKYLFPSSKTYASWYGTSFTAVKNLTQAEVDAIVSGDKNTTAKPGSCVQFVNDSVTYVVDGTSRRAADATACPASAVLTIPEGFRANYSSGAAMSGDRAALGASANLGTVLGLSAVAAPAAVSGPLSVSLASDNVAGAVLPAGASSAVMLKFNITAGATAQTVTAVNLKVVGVGATADLTNVYLYDGATRLTTGRTVAAQDRTVGYSNLSIAVGANSTKTISVVADVAAGIAAAPPTSGDTHAVQVLSLGTTASVSGLPITGATFSVGSQDVSAVTLQRGTDPAGPTIGQKNVPVGEFRLTAGANDVEFRRATVTIGGTVSISDLSNFELWQSSTKLTAGTLASDRVTFDLASPYVITQGSNRLFTVKADVAGRGSRTIATYIDSVYPSDLLVVDKVYGYGAAVTFTSFSALATAAATPATAGSFVTTQGGRTTVAFNGPAAADVARGAQDVVLYKYSITAGDQAVEVRRTGLTIAGTAGGFVRGSAGTRYFTDIKIKNADTGATVQGPIEHASANSATTTGATPCASSGTLCFTDAFTVDAGKTVNLVVTADTANSEDAAADEYFAEGYAVTLEGFGATAMREVSTNQNLAVADIVGGGSAIVGNTMTVQTSSLTVSVTSTPSSGSTVRGTQGVQMTGFAFTAGTSSAVKITQLVFAGEGEDTLGTFLGDGAALLDDLILSASLWDGSTQVGTSKSPVAAGTITFDNLNWNLAAGETKQLTVKTNLATTLLAGASDFAYIGLPVANVTAQDKDSNSITAAAGATVPTNANGAANFLTINSAGTLTVALDGDTPLASLVTSGTSDVTMTKVKFSSAREAFKVNKLRVVNTSGGASDDSSTADNMISQIKLTYKAKDGTMKTSTGVLTTGIANISGLDMYVGVDKTEVLTISANIANLDQTTGRTSVTTPRIGLDMGIAGDTNFEAVGEGSSTSLTLGTDVTAGTNYTNDTGAQDADVVGNTFSVVKSKPTITLDAASPSGGASKQSDVEALRFTVAANASGDLEVSRLTFQTSFTSNATSGAAATWNEPVTQSGAVLCDTSGACTDTANSFDASNIRIYDKDDQNTQLLGTWRLYDSTVNTGTGTLASGEEVGFARFDFATARTIASGTSKTYIVRLDVAGLAPASDDSVSLSVVGDTTSTFAAGSATVRGTNLVWGETGSNNVATTITAGAPTAGITGNLVKNLPVTGGTLIY